MNDADETVGYPIVGVGASAGGIEALRGLFGGIAERPGYGIVVVTHLSAGRESLLHQVIAGMTGLAVHIAEDGAIVEAGAVYVLPSDSLLGIRGRRLELVQGDGQSRVRRPIDVFFSALALDLGEYAAGIVLSGADSDGTLGIKAIKERGGLTLAQVKDGHGPDHPGMPDSAIATGLVDYAIPADEMGAKLEMFARGLRQAERDPSALVAASDPVAGGGGSDIHEIIRRQLGHDFSGYKSSTILRRVQRRMQVKQVPSMEEYVAHLRAEPREVSALFRDLLINVTSFFRDPEAFGRLSDDLLPALLEGRDETEDVRIWVPGCSTGEEAYSIAILVREWLDGRPSAPRVQIFATDIDDRALSVARAGRYPEALLDSVSAERRDRHFLFEGGSYAVVKQVREMCLFSPHNLIRDPPFSRIDLVSCRNLLIYFGIDVQHQVIPTLHYALRNEGLLFLGPAENTSKFEDLFVAVDQKLRIFRKRPASVALRLPPVPLMATSAEHRGIEPLRPSVVAGAVLRQTVDTQVLERFAPPHVLATRYGEVVYFSARTGKYLEPPHGSPSRSLMELARKGLRFELRSLFQEAVSSGRPVLRRSVMMSGEDDRPQMVRISAERLIDRGRQEPLYLVLFEDMGPVLTREEALDGYESARDGNNAQVERDLREARDRLQSTVEEYETSLEELKSSNEELVTVNEELQSTNEELGANKEELQSVNEELQTVNVELGLKVDELDQANGDLRNLFESTEVAAIFLDRELTIRSFTPAIGKIFNILPNDRGRPITDLSSRFRLDGLETELRRVLDDARPSERRVEAEPDGPHYLLRIGPYRAEGERGEGVVLTFLDVTSLVRSEERQGVLIAELQHRTRNLLAVVQSIAEQTLGTGGAIGAFSGRLVALGRVQSLVGRSAGGDVDLGRVIRQEVEAVAGAANRKVGLDGPAVPMEHGSVQVFALAVHELATNAVKHGALREGPGKLAVRWSVRPGPGGRDTLVFDWSETGAAAAPSQQAPAGSHPSGGYGRRLIERSLAFTLQAEVRLAFEPDGVHCRIEVPLP